MLGIEDQGHRAVVDGFYLHIRTELAVLGRVAQFFTDGEEFFVQSLAQFGTGSFGKAGPAAFAAVAVESELADYASTAAASEPWRATRSIA